jgi:hypothetical protein
MKICMIGNCQIRALHAGIKIAHPDIDVVYCATAPMLGDFNPEFTYDQIESADITIAQRIENKDHEYHFAKFESRGAKPIVFFPYLYFDGLFSLCHMPGVKTRSYGVILGSSTIESLLEANPIDSVRRMFLDDEIDFVIVDRLKKSVTEFVSRESACDIRISDFILSRYKEMRVMITHNHPMRFVLLELMRRLGRHIGLSQYKYHENTEVIEKLKLPGTCAILTPGDRRRLGIAWEDKSDWRTPGLRLINMIAAEAVPVTAGTVGRGA